MNTNHDPFPDEVALDEAATMWLFERADGFTPERAREFAAWRDGDSRNAAAIARVERTLALLDEMPAVRGALEARFAGDDLTAAPSAPSQSRRRLIPFPAWVGGLAAVFAVVACAWWILPVSRPEAARYQAESSAPRRVELADGSVIDLNAGSDVRVELTARERRVTLAAGEAHFTVAKDAARPFVVAAGGVVVRAVGTAFNVRLAASGVDVLVVEGKVEVTASATASVRESAAPKPQLAAGERTMVPRDTLPSEVRVERAPPAAIRATLAWQNPVTTFTDVPLREVVTQFNFRNVTQLVLEDPALGERRIGGVIALDQVEAFVRLLEQDGDVVSRRRGENEIGLRAAR